MDFSKRMEFQSQILMDLEEQADLLENIFNKNKENQSQMKQIQENINQIKYFF